MANYLKTIFFRHIQGIRNVPEYVGESMDRIISAHTGAEYHIIPYGSQEAETPLLEIRLGDSTLTCVMENNTCIEAYEFSD